MNSLKVPLHKILINHKEKNLIVEKSGSHHLSQVIKVNITSNGTNWQHVPPDMWEQNITSVR